VHYLCLFYQLRRAHFLIYQGLIGRSPSISRLRLQLWQNVFTHNVRWFDSHLWNRMEDFSTLLLGETGTGKGASAAAVGRSAYIPYDESTQRFEPGFHATFIRVNLSQFSENLLESELFGHRKGAFTGAVDDYEGHLARCRRHGAIFLDELGDISPSVQTKLLKVLEDRTFSPVGSHELCRFEGRIIAATNRDLNNLREEGFFRDDLYYRLCSDVIRIPPLRTRIQEDPREFDDMVTHLVGRMVGEEATEVMGLVKESLRSSPGKDYPWPGNVRELEQAIRRVILSRVYEGDERLLTTDTRDALIEGVESGSMTATELLQGYCRILYDRHRNYVEVARIVGLDRRTVKKYIEQTT
jgi:transcriptional regulator with PAS, ATPase and Fis domain